MKTSKVHSINISKEKGVIKTPVDSITVDQKGIVEDAHRGLWHRQISLLSQEQIDVFSKKEKTRSFLPGEFAENITTSNIDLRSVSLLDQIKINDVVLKVTQLGKKCHGDSCSIFREVGKCVMPKEGIFCKTITGGHIKTGDKIEHIKRPLKIKVITLSDRASQGEYDDLSGPAIMASLEKHFSGTRWHLEIDTNIISDNKNIFREELLKATKNQFDVIISTGGTGLGPRDIAPETVASIIDKEIPGIMENIRIKFGTNIPNALLSRSVAGTLGTTLIYTIPGSVKAVNEYMNEIQKTLEHAILMIHEVGH